ncbi:calcium/sodium antiporter [candidate division KSB1 bacterium]|nr:calcium/sodium antiporter [candidate division KSB1 bacterium]
MLSYFIFLAGLILLVGGADLFVRGSAGLARLMRISSLIIGLTIVAFGTSAPELTVSLRASLAGQSGLSIGNIVGSNIFNVLFILGISALVSPLFVTNQLIRLDVPVMIGVSVLLLLFSLNYIIGRFESVILFCGFLFYTGFLIAKSRKEKQKTDESDKPGKTSPPVLVFFIFAGFVLLVYGSQLLVNSAVEIAASLGVSGQVIGLTIVAAGTSLPETATSVVATLKGNRDIAIGNIIGSNIFNILCIISLSGFVNPKGLSISAPALSFDIPIMLFAAILCFPVFVSGHTIDRAEGGIFLFTYLAYTVYLVVASLNGFAVTIFHYYIIIPVIIISILSLLFFIKRKRI